MKTAVRPRKVNLILRFKSIRTSMLFYFSILIISSLLVFLLFSLEYTQDTILHNSTEYTMQLIEQVNTDIDSYINYMENISQMVTYNDDVRDYLFNSEDTEIEEESLYNRVSAQFKTVMDTRSDISNIAVVTDSGRSVVNRGKSKLNPYVDIEDMEWYQEVMEANGNIMLSSSHVQNMIMDSYKWVVTLSRGLQNPATHEIEGAFFIDLNYSAINDLCENISLGNKGYIFIIDSGGSIIYHPQQQLLYSGLKEERTEEVMNSMSDYFLTEEGDNSKLYTISKSEKTGWTVVGVAYTSELMKNWNEIQMMYLFIAALLFAAAMGIAILLSREITKPIKALGGSMKEVEKGHFDNAGIVVSGENEIAGLSNSFNIMTKEIQKLMEQNVQEQRQKRKSELKALQSQINPHFLYNTLDSIIWMAEGGKNQEVVLMTSSLAKLLRQSISNEDEIVTIEKEVGYTRSYLTIQKMRYKDKLEFDIQVDSNILQMKIVKLVVQPLVENAIYHGIKYIEEKGMIRITGEKSRNKVILSVSDNGIGMKAEQLSHILSKSGDRQDSKGVGVYNVHNRLQLYYGKEYGLSFESWEGFGTTVHIIIPGPGKEGADHGEV